MPIPGSKGQLSCEAHVVQRCKNILFDYNYPNPSSSHLLLSQLKPLTLYKSEFLVSLCTGFLKHTIQIENQLKTQHYNRIKEANTSLTWNLKVENTIVDTKTKSKAKMEKKGVNSGKKNLTEKRLVTTLKALMTRLTRRSPKPLWQIWSD